MVDVVYTKGRRPPGAMLYSLHESSELLRSSDHVIGVITSTITIIISSSTFSAGTLLTV